MATEEATKYTVYKYTLGLLTYERGRYRQADRRGERDKATERLRERRRERKKERERDGEGERSSIGRVEQILTLLRSSGNVIGYTTDTHREGGEWPRQLHIKRKQTKPLSAKHHRPIRTSLSTTLNRQIID